jgi:hypothetical protein
MPDHVRKMGMVAPAPASTLELIGRALISGKDLSAS